MDRTYYRVDSGPVLDAVRKWQLDRSVALEARKQVLASIPGADHYYGDDHGITAVQFDASQPIPKGWIKAPKGGHRPSKKRPELAHILESWEIPGPMSGSAFQSYIDPALWHLSFMNGMAISTMSFETLCGNVVLGVPACPCSLKDATDVMDEKQKGLWKAPEGCVELKMSEYWQLKEQEKDARKKNP